MAHFAFVEFAYVELRNLGYISPAWIPQKLDFLICGFALRSKMESGY